MKSSFIEKKIAFLGDSITQGGTFINYMRYYFLNAGERVYLFNRGNAGCRAEMALQMLEDEILSSPFDIVFIQYGINDMGIWLYDSNKKVDEELLKKREIRTEKYLSSIRDIALKIKRKGITPIFVTLVPVNERLDETQKIKTVADNKEKEDYIGPEFYTKKTFKNINEGCKYYSKKLVELAKELEIEVVDMFNPFYSKMLENDGLFRVDGIHPTENGHLIMAKAFLAFMGCSGVNSECKYSEKQKKVIEVERKIRGIQSFRRELFQETNDFSEKELYELAVKEVDSNPGYSATTREGVKDFWFKIQELKDQELKLALDLYN